MFPLTLNAVLAQARNYQPIAVVGVAAEEQDPVAVNRERCCPCHIIVPGTNGAVRSHANHREVGVITCPSYFTIDIQRITIANVSYADGRLILPKLDALVIELEQARTSNRLRLPDATSAVVAVDTLIEVRHPYRAT